MLTRAGFPDSQLEKIKDSSSGHKKLRDLAKLLQRINQSSSRTHLATLIDAGLIKANSWIEQLIGVVNKSGGSNNLEALCGLLKPLLQEERSLVDSQKILRTQLDLLIDRGFMAEKLINVVSHDGGSNNLEALCGLLKPLLQEEQSLDGKKILRTQLDVLIDRGFTVDRLIDVVSHNGGSKNLKALIDLSRKVSAFIHSYQNSADHIVALANTNSRSTHIEFLTEVLLIKECNDFISQSQNLADVCKSIARFSARVIKDKPISLASLKALLPKRKSLPPVPHSLGSDHNINQNQPINKKYKRENSTTNGSLDQSNSNIEVNMAEDFTTLKSLPLSQQPSSSDIGSTMSFLNLPNNNVTQKRSLSPIPHFLDSDNNNQSKQQESKGNINHITSSSHSALIAGGFFSNSRILSQGKGLQGGTLKVTSNSDPHKSSAAPRPHRFSSSLLKPR